MREIWVIVKVNFYGEEIDRCSKEFESCESAERYLFNTGYFDNPYLWSIRKETRIPMVIGKSYSRKNRI